MGNETKLTTHEAYAAMFTYLLDLYERTQMDDLGGLLGSMSLLPDGTPADPAIWSDWLKAVQAVKEKKTDINLGL